MCVSSAVHWSVFVSLVRIPGLLLCPSCQLLTFCHRPSPPIHKRKLKAGSGQGRARVWCASAARADDIVQPTVLFKVQKGWGQVWCLRTGSSNWGRIVYDGSYYKDVNTSDIFMRFCCEDIAFEILPMCFKCGCYIPPFGKKMTSAWAFSLMNEEWRMQS